MQQSVASTRSRPDRPVQNRIGRSKGRLDPLAIAGPILFVSLWGLLSAFAVPSSLPSPLAVVRRIGIDFVSAPTLAFYGLTDAGLMWSMLYTATNVAIAVAVGSALGIAGGLITARVPPIRAVLDPIMMTAGTVPILVAAPFLLIWFGIGRTSAVMLVVFYVAVILYLFAQRAADNLDPVYEDSARTLGASEGRILLDIFLPGTVPMMLGGVRIALAGAWGMEAIAELLGAQQGIGKVVQVLAGVVDIEGIFAALVVLGIVAFGADCLAAFLIRQATAWNVAARPQGA
jgi:ABC-type nitrate/sulfonate/bicarbonate transport system permease component